MRVVALLALALLLPCPGSAQQLKPPLFVIHKSTIIAFFPAMTSDPLDKDEDTNEALSDFQFYAGAVKPRLQNAGIDFIDTDAIAFRVQTRKARLRFSAGKITVGYYFIAPGKKPHILYGVMTDEDLIDEARKYFHLAIK